MEFFFSPEGLSLIPPLIGLGVFVGFIAGLLGVGGGIYLVPAFYYMFAWSGMEQAHLMHLAVGTSLAVIIPTGLSSFYAHYKKGAVNFDWALPLAGGVMAGVLIATFVAAQVSGMVLKVFFASALPLLALSFFVPRAKAVLFSDAGPKGMHSLFGVLVGGVSTLIGIGGAALSVPYLSAFGMSIHRAIGTASSLGPVIALPGALGFILIGWAETASMPGALGYVFWPAWLVVIPLSILMAPVGARMAHALPVDILRRVFGFFLMIVAAKMWWDIIYV